MATSAIIDALDGHYVSVADVKRIVDRTEIASEHLLGVTLGDVSDNETAQLSMFQDDQKDRARKLDQTVDQLRSKFGVSAISRGSVTDATKRVGRKYKAQLDDRNKK
mgnify:CR=1 FL=1